MAAGRHGFDRTKCADRLSTRRRHNLHVPLDFLELRRGLLG
jgi:hypothetical protein